MATTELQEQQIKAAQEKLAELIRSDFARIERMKADQEVTDFSKLEDARVEVDGEDLFYLLQSYESKPANDTPEAHKKYVDIQFLISGREKMGVGALEDMKEEVEAHPERDIWFYHGPLDEITLGGDKFVVLFPGDAHAPNIAVDGPEPVRKCVVKVKL